MPLRNPWDPQRTPCCGSHSLGLPCCDPDDCGPCCPECPTCPTRSYWRGIEKGIETGLDMGELAAHYHKRENPINGDGTNTSLAAVIGSIKLLREADALKRNAMMNRLSARIAERVSRVGF